jgi:pyrroloquinoline quinone biosynthesis protein D
MTSEHGIRRPLLVRHARYRWDSLRRQHQLVYPEGILVLNETGAAIVKLCDGRELSTLVDVLKEQFSRGDLADDVQSFLQRLASKGLIRDAAAS